MQLNTYLTFDGNCREAFDFYLSVFGGEYLVFQTFGDGPPEMEVPAAVKDNVMHVSLPIGDSVLMGSDTGPGQPGVSAGDNFSISVNADSRAQCDDLFAKMSAGGEVTMPMQDTFWGSYFGTCRDRFGINWMIDFDQGNG